MEHQEHYFKMQSTPMEAACNPLLSPSDKTIYSSLYFLKKSSNAPCIVSDEYLSNYNQLSIIGVGKSLKKLEDLKYIKRETIKSKNRIGKIKSQRYIYIQKEEIWMLLMDLWNFAFPQKNEEAREAWHEIKENLTKNINFENAQEIILKILPTYKNLYMVAIKKYRWDLYKIIDILKRDITKDNYKEIITSNNKESEKSDSKIIDKPPKKAKKIYNIKRSFENNYSRNLIKFWNSFESTSNHSIDKPFTKTYYDLIKNLTKLQKGTFAKNKSFSKEWIKTNNIPDNYFNKVWSFQELKDAIINLSKYSIEGYWPQNKTYYKNLLTLIYNPNSEKSLLFNAIKNPPKKLKEKLEDDFKNEYPLTTEIVKDSPIWDKDKNLNEIILCKNFKKLADFSYNLINDGENKATYWYGDLEKIVREYLKWLELDQQDWITKEERIFDTGSKIFTMFIENQEKDLNIEIRSKGWKRKL